MALEKNPNMRVSMLTDNDYLRIAKIHAKTINQGFLAALYNILKT
ncbi:hypothetical protein CRENPOLYSF2_3640009 [Crenothrix polyspora]|uniref:Uncharacterized protein n=1 Tax=Crenothrix polyspora TaxID=360316 RepID=A0A1R4HC95_9GAMM|nr:hypothetical protein CRENPOLYSF2_3640009 [Crenothrix polyspora]